MRQSSRLEAGLVAYPGAVLLGTALVFAAPYYLFAIQMGLPMPVFWAILGGMTIGILLNMAVTKTAIEDRDEHS